MHSRAINRNKNKIVTEMCLCILLARKTMISFDKQAEY